METRPNQEERPARARLLSPPPACSDEGPAEAALVFAGSSEQDVVLAKTFWDSVTLQPPLESCLAARRPSPPSDAGTAQSSGTGSRRPSIAAKYDISARSSFNKKEEERKQGALQAEKNAMKEQYLNKAKKRDEIIALLKKQREERIAKETFANLRRSSKMLESKEPATASDLEDQETVKALN